MKYGFIGYGNMGSVLVNRLLESGSIDAGDVAVANRTVQKLEVLKERFPDLVVTGDFRLAADADMVFLCVGTDEVRPMIERTIPSIRRDAHLVTINGGLQIKNLETLFDGKISKVIPSMTMRSGRGVTLLCHNAKVDSTSRIGMEYMFRKVGTVQTVLEHQFEIAADLTSCAPAFIADFAQKFAEAGARHSDLDQTTANRLVIETMLGTALLLAEEGISFDELKSSVATKGGITEQGLKVLDRDLPMVLDQVLEATVGQHERVKQRITCSFGDVAKSNE